MRGLTPKTLALAQQMLRENWLPLVRTWNRSSIGSLAERVIASREPAAIPYLIPLGLSGNASLRRQVREGIASLYRLMPVEQLPELDQRLRSGYHWPFDWYSIKASTVAEVRAASEADDIYVGLLASHPSGFVHERALRLMRDRATPEVVPLALLRLTDWVEPVRQQAKLCVDACLKPENAAAVVAALPLLERMRQLVRWFHTPQDAIDTLLEHPAAVKALQEGMRSPKRDVRRLCFRYAAGNSGFRSEDVVARAADDDDALIRQWAYTAGRIQRFVARAAGDVYAPNRWLAFKQMCGTAETLRPFLLDRATSLRQECQRLLRAKFGEDPAFIYRRSMDNDVAILGLGETGGRGDVTAMLPCLNSRHARVRRAAVRALDLLDGTAQRQTFLRVVANDTPAVAGQATMALLKERDLLVPLIWQAAKKNQNAQTRWSVLRLLKEKWKWSLLAVYLDALLDPDTRVQALAGDQLERWTRRFGRSFLQPTSAERAALEEMRRLGRVHPEWRPTVDRALGDW